MVSCHKCLNFHCACKFSQWNICLIHFYNTTDRLLLSIVKNLRSRLLLTEFPWKLTLMMVLQQSFDKRALIIIPIIRILMTIDNHNFIHDVQFWVKSYGLGFINGSFLYSIFSACKKWFNIAWNNHWNLILPWIVSDRHLQIIHCHQRKSWKLFSFLMNSDNLNAYFWFALKIYLEV